MQALLNQADLAYRAGRLSEAELLYVDWLKLVAGHTEAHVWQIATCLQRLGDMYNYSGRYIEADLSYSRLLMLGEKTCGLDQPELSKIRATLAQVKAKISDSQSIRPPAGASGAAGCPTVVSDGRMTQSPVLESHQAQQQHDNSGPLSASRPKSAIAGDGTEAGQDLFGFGPAERKSLAQQPVFKKLRSPGPEHESRGSRRTSPVLRVFVVASASAVALCLCIPNNTAGCLALVGDWQKSCKSPSSALYLYDLAARLNPKSADIAYKQASLKLDQHDFEQAVADFSRAIAIDPKSSQAYLERGMARSKIHDDQNALVDFDRFIAFQPKNANAYVCRGSAYTRLGQYDNAVRDYNEATKLDHTNSEASYYRTWTLDLQYDEMMEREATQVGAQVGNAQGSKQSTLAVKTAVQKSPQNVAKTLDKTLDQTKIALLDKKIAASPKDATLYCDRARLSLNLGKLKAAIADYGAAIALNAGFADAYNNRGLAYFKLDQYDKAIRDYSQNIVLDGQNASAYYRRAIAFDRLGKYDLAASDYQRASSLNPLRAKTYLALANADLNRLPTPQSRSFTVARAPGVSAAGAGQSVASAGTAANTPPGSHADKTAAPKSVPTEAELFTRHVKRGWDYLRSHEYKNSLREFDEAASHGRPGKGLYHGRALAYWNLGDQNQALDNINRAIKLAPNDKNMSEERDKMQAYFGRQPSAQPNNLSAQQPAGDIQPTQQGYMVHYGQGQKLSNHGQPAEALTEFNAALADKPPSGAQANIYCARGRAYWRLHDHGRALADCNESIRLKPGSSTYSLRAKIYRAMGREDLASADDQLASVLQTNKGHSSNVGY